MRLEGDSASQAKRKLERVLVEVLQGKKDLQMGATPSVLALQGRMEELKLSYERELARAMEERNSREAEHFEVVAALQGQVRDCEEVLQASEDLSASQLREAKR